MKKYKVVNVNSAEALELTLNEYSQNGWKVISANLAASSSSEDFVYFALLENQSLEDEIKKILEENINEVDSEILPSDN